MVTIIGGGIAGAVLAGALGRARRPVTVYESQPTGGAGAFLVLDRRAHEALVRLGVSADRLHEASHPVEALRADGVPGPARGNPAPERRLYLRAELMRVLTEFATDSPADMRFGTPITEVDCAAGTLVSGARPVPADDLIIAADGIDSVARRAMEPGRAAEYAGQIVVYGITRQPTRPGTDPSVLHFDRTLGADGRAVSTFGHLWNDTVAVWFTRLTRPPLDRQHKGAQPMGQWTEAVLAGSPAVRDTIEPLLANTDSVHVSNARTVPLAGARAPRDPVILCGDADHAITPAAGVGARDAIEDAAALYAAIVSDGTPAAAMTERRRRILGERERVAQISRTAT
ncbi:NAD(P)-binding protein [Nocardia brasiliensis]|uniref:NAD(P)-binding protein n=1 Tax=Nocardia brasiliensis TaxID=37326 RepID=A0A6G9XP40_NOCBR|nr:NAD(P)/FAD-dependent oxidoreductase [Nocardia brasiliensis]QIS02613.1 NAD(P)-binding protein [Nocardia brasiliensis]